MINIEENKELSVDHNLDEEIENDSSASEDSSKKRRTKGKDNNFVSFVDNNSFKIVK